MTNPEKRTRRNKGRGRSWTGERVDPGKAIEMIKRLLREEVPPRKELFAISFVCILFAAATTSGYAMIMRYMVNNIFVDQKAAHVVPIAMAVVVISIGKGISTYFQSITAAKIRMSIATGFQIKQFAKLVSMDLRYFGKRHASEFMTELRFSATGGASAVMTLTSNMIRDGMTLVFLLGVMVVQDPLMSILTFLIMPALVVTLSVVVRKIKKLANQQIQQNSNVAAVGTESIEGIKVVKSFGLEENAVRSFRGAVRKLERTTLKATRTSSLMSPVMETLGGFVIAAFIVYASWQSLANDRTPGEYMAFITAFMLAYEPAKRLARIHVDLQKNMVAVERLYSVLDATPDNVRPLQHLNGDAKIRTGAIEFENVSFLYDPEKPVLHGISFSIRHGERVAIVGRSGAGKTTIVNLILGFILPDQGGITIDGYDIAALPYDNLRQGVSLIAQDVFLFEGTIRDNIRDGNPKADDEAIQRAADNAAVSVFLKDLPLGLDTPVGPNGMSLSGGQRQRVSIARALIKDAPILIYDEATSALDGESERTVMSASLRDTGDRTVICIAHRLSTIKSFDRIIVLDEGRIADSGTYDEIAARNSIFRSIFHLHNEETRPSE